MTSILFGTPKSLRTLPKGHKSNNVTKDLTKANNLSNQVWTGLYRAHSPKPASSNSESFTSDLTTRNVAKERKSVFKSTTKAYKAKEYINRILPSGSFQEWDGKANYVGLNHVSNDHTSKWSSRLRSPSNSSMRKKITSTSTLHAGLLTKTSSKTTNCKRRGRFCAV